MDLIEVARLEEARQARGVAEIADETRAFGGGIAARGKPGSWLNNCVGMGLNGPVPREEIESVVSWYVEAGIEPRMEVSPFVEAAFLKDCAGLGLVAKSFESVLFRELGSCEDTSRAAGRALPVFSPPPELRIERIDPADPAMVRRYAEVVAANFFPPGVRPSENDIEVSMRCVRHPRTVALGAFIGDGLIGGGACEIADGVAALFGLSVNPEHRRRGIQQALIAARLNLAVDRGARVATIGSRPGAPTERNVRRMGFQMAYTKVVLAKSGPGLAPMFEG